MAQSKKLIKSRIKSIRNTRKITKAMELVAASKMRKAVASALKSRPYSREAWATVRAILSVSPDLTHYLLEPKAEASKSLFIVMSADRGLAGGLNVNLQRAALSKVKEIGGAAQVEAIALGKRGGDALEKVGVKLVARFGSLTNNPQFVDILPAARLALQRFLAGECKEVFLVFTDYVSGVTQKPTVTQLLPLKPNVSTSPLPPPLPFDSAQGRQEGGVSTPKRQQEFLFEPTPAAVLDRTLPAIAEAIIWQSLLESAASEHAARMIAMKNASDAAKDMLNSLTFTYNQARQAGITAEIAEISSGKAALE